jgi:hypothetical protein
MKLARFLLSCVVCFCASAQAQTTVTSGNLIGTPTVTLAPYLRNTSYAYAVNQALASVGAGVKIAGFDYGFNYTVYDGAVAGYLNWSAKITNSAETVNLYESSGSVTGNGSVGSIHRSQSFGGLTDLADIGTFKLSFASNQNTGVGNVYSQARYAIDPCVTNPLSSPSCAGYNDVVTSQNIYATSYAINQALNLSGSGVRINGFSYGYNVLVGGQWCLVAGENPDGTLGCSAWSTSSMAVKTHVTDSAGDTVYLQSHYHTDQNTNAAYSYSVVLDQKRSPSSLGNFNMSVGQWGTGAVYNMWSNWQYTPDACVANPLSSPGCDGYAVALFTQQCTANPMSDSACPGYAAAFFTQQCTATAMYNPSCPGYAAAYRAQQCSLNPLYASDCPGYQQAYLNAQCIQDSLYSRQCEGYNTAYAVKYLTPLNSSVTTAVNSSLSTIAVTQARDVAARINTDGSVSTTPQLISDSTVNSVLTSRPDTTSALSPTSVLRPANNALGSVNPVGNLQPGGGGAPAPAANQMAQRQEERKSEEKKTDNAVAAVEKEVGSKSDNKSDSKSDNKSGGGRPENREKVREAMTARAKELASDMSRAATLEAQTANQAVVLGLISYVPGFSAYQNSQVPDSLGQAVARQYGRATVDNRGAQRGLSVANDRLHQEMVNQQYK